MHPLIARLIAGILLLGVLGPSVHGDILSEGEHGVNHEFVVHGLRDFPEYEFYVYPASFHQDARQVIDGKGFRYYWMSSARLYAVPRPVPWEGSKKVPTGWFKEPDRIQAEETFSIERPVSNDVPHTERETAYRLERIEGARLVLTLMHDRKSGTYIPRRNPSDLVVPFLLGVLFLLAVLFGLTRRRSQAPGAAPDPEPSRA